MVRLIITFPPSHDRQLSAYGPNGTPTPFANLVAPGNVTSMWYPDSGATLHITTSYENIQSLSNFHCSNSVLTANGNPMLIDQYGKSVVSCQSSKFLLDDLLYLLMPQRIF